MTGKVIILNGASSAGKTSLAKAFQALASEPYLHAQSDVFTTMAPAGFFGSHPDRDWPTVRRFQRGMHRSVAQFALTGHNLIQDGVLVRHHTIAELLTIYGALDVYFVGVHCPLDELERREQARGDRDIGLAAAQFLGVHLHKVYDVEIYTSQMRPEAGAQRLWDFVAENRPKAFAEMTRRFESGELIGESG